MRLRRVYHQKASTKESHTSSSVTSGFRFLKGIEITHILCTAGNHTKCTSRAFYYNPSQYSASNKDFVHNSVASLYTKLNSSACPVKLTLQGEINNENIDQCMSTMLEPSVFVVRLVCLVLRKIVMIFYYLMQICGVCNLWRCREHTLATPLALLQRTVPILSPSSCISS